MSNRTGKKEGVRKKRSGREGEREGGRDGWREREREGEDSRALTSVCVLLATDTHSRVCLPLCVARLTSSLRPSVCASPRVCVYVCVCMSVCMLVRFVYVLVCRTLRDTVRHSPHGCRWF